MTATAADKFERFKRLHSGPEAFVIPNPWDAGSARILTALGFEALATTSAGFAFSIGQRDSFAGLTRDRVLEGIVSHLTHIIWHGSQRNMIFIPGLLSWLVKLTKICRILL